jgi:hypothetical protein
VRIEYVCPCGRVLAVHENAPGQSDEDLVASHQARLDVLTCTDEVLLPVEDDPDRPGQKRTVAGPARLVRAGCWSVYAPAPLHPKNPKARDKREAVLERNLAAAHQDIGRVLGPRREPHVVLRGEGRIDAGRGPLSQLRALHEAHVRRGGRYDPPPKPQPATRGAPRGTVIVETPSGQVRVPPGRVQLVGQLLVDTTDPSRVRVTAAPSVPPGKEKVSTETHGEVTP